MKKGRTIIVIPVLLSFFIGISHSAQIPLEKLLEEVFSVPAPSGYEQMMAEKIQQYLPRSLAAETDNLGSLYVTAGNTGQRMAILTCMDELGYVVSGISDEGYLLLDRVVPAPHPLYDSFHAGHPMRVWTEKGAVSGVMALPSVHILSREGRQQLQRFSLDQAFLDVGVQSREEVKQKGIQILDAVTPFQDLTPLAGDRISGFSLGNKACLALLLHLAGEIDTEKLEKKTTFVWMAQTHFYSRGSRPKAAMGAHRVKMNLNPENVLILGIVPVERDTQKDVALGRGPVLAYSQDGRSEISEQIEEIAENEGISLQHFEGFESSLMSPFADGKTSVLILGLPVKFSSTPAEVLDMKDARSLEKLLSVFLRGEQR